jgi:hypothetical protein
VRCTHKKIDIDEGLPCQHFQSIRVYLENFPATAFGNFNVLRSQMTVICYITPELEGFFVDEVSHDIVFKG